MTALPLVVHVPGAPPVRVGMLPEGDAGIEATVAGMFAMIRDALTVPSVRRFPARLTVPTDAPGYPLAVEAWLRRKIVFKDDPPGIEKLQSPDLLLLAVDSTGSAFGDCDDVAMLGASALAVAGYTPVLIVVGLKPKFRGGRFQHVFYGFLIDPAGPAVKENVVPFDPQERMTPGVWPDRFPRVGIFRIGDGSH